MAESRGIRVIRLRPSIDHAAGIFTLDFRGRRRTPRPCSRKSGDEALVLHTSGTTARPKMVPLTQANLAASIENIIATLALTPRDRCLNVMPLFHVNGMVGAVLASLAAGASVVCTPGFQAPAFLRMVSGVRADMVLRRSRDASVDARARARTSGPGRKFHISLHPVGLGAAASALMAEMERVFGVPVIEGYGMTETAQQISVNPLPPGERKPGSVGIPGRTEVGIIGRGWRTSGPGRDGEIVVRGPGVTAGYANNPNGEPRIVYQRMVSDGRPGQARCGRLPVHHRTNQGNNQSRRPEDIACAKSTS